MALPHFLCPGREVISPNSVRPDTELRNRRPSRCAGASTSEPLDEAFFSERNSPHAGSLVFRPTEKSFDRPRARERRPASRSRRWKLRAASGRTRHIGNPFSDGLNAIENHREPLRLREPASSGRLRRIPVSSEGRRAIRNKPRRDPIREYTRDDRLRDAPGPRS